MQTFFKSSIHFMKYLFILFSFFLSGLAWAQNAGPAEQARLSTADKEDYLTDNEKQVYYYLNLARTQPAYFADSVLKVFSPDGDYLQTSPNAAGLYQQLKAMKPVGPLQPDKELYLSAQCFAQATGKSGQTGHDRRGTDCPPVRGAECNAYGRQKALDVVVQLLVDKDVPTLAHRTICLGAGYSRLGVSIQPHKEYRYTAVLDFK